MIKKTKNKCENLFLDWFNNFLTLEAISLYYGVPEKKMLQALKIGRKVNLLRKEPVDLAELEFPF